MTPVGFEPAQLALAELESTPLDHSGKVSISTAMANDNQGFVNISVNKRRDNSLGKQFLEGVYEPTRGYPIG